MKDKELLKEDNDRKLLRLEIYLSISMIVVFFICIFVGMSIDNGYSFLIVTVGFVILMFGASICLRLEQKAGYYKCSKCGNKYVPTYLKVFLAPHIGRTRYMKCLKCKKNSWNRKVLK